jgi:hypothetical protein
VTRSNRLACARDLAGAPVAFARYWNLCARPGACAYFAGTRFRAVMTKAKAAAAHLAYANHCAGYQEREGFHRG